MAEMSSFEMGTRPTFARERVAPEKAPSPAAVWLREGGNANAQEPLIQEVEQPKLFAERGVKTKRQQVGEQHGVPPVKARPSHHQPVSFGPDFPPAPAEEMETEEEEGPSGRMPAGPGVAESSSPAATTIDVEQEESPPRAAAAEQKPMEGQVKPWRPFLRWWRCRRKKKKRRHKRGRHKLLEFHRPRCRK